MQEQRPVYRIAAAGLDPRDVRLIEIVFKHSQYNRFEFVLDDGSDPHTVDVLLANTAAPEGLQAVSAVRKLPRHVPVVAAVPRGVPSPARHAISIDRLTLQLLPILNRVVEAELLSPDTQPMTVPLPHDDAQFPAAWPQPGVAAAAGQAAPSATPASPSAPARLPATNAAPAARTRPAGAMPAPPAGASASRPAAGRPGASPAPASSAGGAPTGRAAMLANAATVAAPTAPAARPAASPDGARPAMPPRTSAAAAGAARPPEPASPPAAAGGRQGSAGVDPALRRPRILVVDDSPTVRQQLGIAFTRMGFVCEMVATGALALDRLAAARYDLVMVDVMIPDMDGYRLTREIRKGHRGTPVIILSSRGSPFDHARGLLAGCKAYLAKPVPLRELEAAILKTLRKSVAAGELEQLLRNAAAARAAAARGAAERVAAPAAPPGRPAQAVARPAAASAPQPADARA